jgi:5-methylcytosine-specific restriction endonuclease McrA
MASDNPRYMNYTARTNLRNRVRAMGLPCAICGKPIDYSLDWWVDPKDGRRKRHPWSYELDEIVPISKGGSPTDISNVQPVHRCCNQMKGDGTTKRYRKHIRAHLMRREHSQEW